VTSSVLSAVPHGKGVAAALEQIAGPENVFEDRTTLASFAKDESFAPATMPRAVVRPRTAEEVQRIVRLAAESRTPLVPVSSGPPHFRGDTVPGEGGAVVVDLSAMRGIPRVDRRNRVAIVEPGVTFGELIPALAAEGLAPYLPLVPRATKSVLASMLEREPHTAPRHHWDAQDPLLCIEVVFGTGDVFRTGSAAGPGTLEEQRKAGGAQMRGMGPGQTDLQRLVQGAQGTFGIVTWASQKCRLLAKRREALLVASDSLEALSSLCREVLRVPLGDDLLVLRGATLAAIVGRDRAEIRRLRSALPAFVLHFGVDGTGALPAERIAYQIEDFAALAQREGLAPARVLEPRIRAVDLAAILSGPSAEPYWKLRETGACEEILFLSTLDRAADLFEIVRREAEHAGYPASRLGFHVQPTVQGTSCHCEVTLPYAREDAAQVRSVRRCLGTVSASLLDAGAFFSRPYGDAASEALRRDAVAARVVETLRGIFDPHRVMNPGKVAL
jgi:FAD/FMN-containing dehydrogenase